MVNIVVRILIRSLDVIVMQDVKTKQLQETLIHAQEALVIQILLDALHQYKKVGFDLLQILPSIQLILLDSMYTCVPRTTRCGVLIRSSNVYYKSYSR